MAWVPAVLALCYEALGEPVYVELAVDAVHSERLSAGEHPLRCRTSSATLEHHLQTSRQDQAARRQAVGAVPEHSVAQAHLGVSQQVLPHQLQIPQPEEPSGRGFVPLVVSLHALFRVLPFRIASWSAASMVAVWAVVPRDGLKGVISYGNN